MSRYRDKRIEEVNELLKVISTSGRCFFQRDGFTSYFELSADKRRVYFIDYYTKKRINADSKRVHWSGFTSGGTLRRLVELLACYVRNGSQLNPSIVNSPHWGYGDDMTIVRDSAIKLGIAKQI